MSLLDRLLQRQSRLPHTADEELSRQVYVLYGVFANLVSAERLVLEAGKYNALSFLHAEDPRKRLAALARMVFETEDIPVPTDAEVEYLLDRIETKISEMLARQAVEERLEQKINDLLDQKQQEYMHDLRLEILAEETGDYETPQSREKLATAEKLEKIHLTETIQDKLRPQQLDDVVGQKWAIESMLAKLSSPYPQHLLLYGPPGVGKTTTARLVLEAAKQSVHSPFGEQAPFIETDGTTLRWDSRDMTNPLIGSVHDPIYQGAQRDLAETGIPEPKPGLVTQAHGGVLFIDEIGEMDPLLLNKLLKVLEDKRVYFESSYYNEDDPRVLEYIRRLFRDGAPADFILIGATTRSPEEINPAIRSRCAEVFFEPLTTSQVETIVKNAACSLDIEMEDGLANRIAQYTDEGRKAVQLLADAYGLAAYQNGERTPYVSLKHLERVLQAARLSPQQRIWASRQALIGHVYGLGVCGYSGSVLEVEAAAFPAKEEGKGKLRFNDTAGSMAKDSVFNALSAVRRLINKRPEDYDLHVNIIGGAQIDGPSAGTAITLAIASAIENRPLRQDVALTGEVSLGGKVKAVGGIFEKSYGAYKAGMRYMILPKENKDIAVCQYEGMELIWIETIEEAAAFMFVESV